MKSDNDWRGKNFSFFSNTDCEYFPCHNSNEVDIGNFNCLFCFCPLYLMEHCGGSFVYLNNGCKDCSACVFPHKKENYELVIKAASSLCTHRIKAKTKKDNV